MIKQLIERSGIDYVGALRGVSSDMVMLVAPVNTPSTGEVRPKAADAPTTHFVDDLTGGVCVRSWSPPV
ncbi:hypothetical protein [Haloactinopolyspora sp.]|uniref:hypothetical protein n=1 Tax=Haloactinopolyspora sp. TaxID=1966353 RepID=UPI00262C9757|nr:hypothetical protein [Haloactinopolyspora sp.]